MLSTRLLVLLLVIPGLAAGLLAAWYFPASQPVTTVILVRHAEKNIEPDNPNPALSLAGQERAQTLVHMLAGSAITDIYATQFIRTQSTVAPLADRLGLKQTNRVAKSTEWGRLSTHEGGCVAAGTITRPQLRGLGGGSFQ